MLGKINKKKCFLALIQEPYCYKGSLAAIPGKADYVPSVRTGDLERHYLQIKDSNSGKSLTSALET